MASDTSESAWPLSAPESLVLYWGPDTGDAWALKLALIELVVRREFSLFQAEEKVRFSRAQTVNVLARQSRAVQTYGRPLQAVLDGFPIPVSYADGRTGVPVEQAALTIFRRSMDPVRGRLGRTRWQPSRRGFVDSEIMPLLEQRGIYTQARLVRFGLRGIERWDLTPEGLVALAHLRSIVQSGYVDLKTWVFQDPARASDFLRNAAAALLLIRGLPPLCHRLAFDRGDRLTRDRIGPMPAMGLSSFDPGPKEDPWSAPVIGGSFGPGDLDMAFHLMATDVDRAWAAANRSSGWFIFGE